MLDKNDTFSITQFIQLREFYNFLNKTTLLMDSLNYAIQFNGFAERTIIFKNTATVTVDDTFRNSVDNFFFFNFMIKYAYICNMKSFVLKSVSVAEGEN